MKNIIYWLCWAWSILLFIPVTIDATNNELVAWVITDLHYLSESLHDKDGEAYQHIKKRVPEKTLIMVLNVCKL